MPTSPTDGPPRVVIAGSGFAAIEAALALRHRRSADALRITLLSPAERFRYPPLAVLAPFTREPEWTLPLRTIADELDLELHRGTIASVDADARVAWTPGGDALPYDALLVATGARADRSLEGAVPFRGPQDAPRVGALLDAVVADGGGTVAFVAPTAAWALPLYELALLSAAELDRRGAHQAQVVVVTHAADPLGAFGAQAADVARARLARHGVVLRTAARPVRVEPGAIVLEDGERIAADHVVAMPALHPRAISGLPTDAAGFLPIDRHARVVGRPGVYAAGDATAEPIKQGGLACQQADAAAEALLADLGADLRPTPYLPVLRAVLVSDDDPAYLRMPLDRERSGALPAPTEPAVRPGAWPAGKVVGHYLSPYLSERADGPWRPDRPVAQPR